MVENIELTRRRRTVYMPFWATTSNPVSGQTVYFSQWGAAPLTTTSVLLGLFHVAGFIRRMTLNLVVGGTLDSVANSGSAWIRINSATDYLIGTGLLWNAAFDSNNVIYENDEIAVSAASWYEIKITYPTFSTSPTSVIYSGGLLIEDQ